MTNPERRRITLERRYRADLADAWALWTTKDGIEAWWGPEGFRVEVRSLELRPGGRLAYAMIAEGEGQIAFMKQHGMPLVTEATITYETITPMTRLAYAHTVDFVPGREAYDNHTLLELRQDGDEVALALTVDAMHSEEWTNRMVAGWESELGKLGRALAARKK